MTTETEEARMQIERAKAQIAEQRTAIADRRSEASQTKEQLLKAQTALPSFTSQRALRQKYSGLQGRKIRQGIENAKNKIGKDIASIEGYEGELSTAEQSIAEFETTQIAPVEQQIKAIEDDKVAFEKAQKLFDDRISPSYVQDEPAVQDYLVKMYRDYNFAKEQYNKQQEEYYKQRTEIIENMRNSKATYFQGDKIIFEGLESPKPLETVSIDFSRQGLNTRDIGAMGKVKDAFKNINFSGDPLPVVSAQSLNNGTTLKGDGTTTVLSGMAIGVDGSKYSNNSSGSWFSRVFGNSKTIGAGYEKYKEGNTSSFASGQFINVAATGTQGTGILTAVTPYDKQFTAMQRNAVIDAKVKGFLFAPIKFAQGEYEWQKKITGNPEDYVKKTEEYRKNLPFFVTKPQEYASEGIVRGSEWGVSKATGRNATIPSAQRIETKRAVGDILTLGFFAPSIKTGTYGEEEAETSIFKKKKKRLLQLQEQVPEEQVKTMEAEPYIKELEDLWKESGTARVQARLRQLLEVMKRQTTPEGKETALKNIKFLLKKASERNLIKAYALNEKTGEIAFMGEQPIKLSTKPFVVQSKGTLLKAEGEPLKVVSKGTMALETEQLMSGAASKSGQLEYARFFGTYNLQKPKSMFKLVSASEQAQESQTRQDSKLGLKSITILKSASKQMSNQKTNQATKTLQNSATLSALASVLKFNLRTNQVSKTENVFRESPRNTNNPVEEKPTKNKPPRIPRLSSGGLQRLAKKAETEPELFEIFKKSKGKEVKVGEARDVFEASKKLKSSLKSDLSASGFATKGGRKVKASELGVDFEFRIGKRDNSLLVQRKGGKEGGLGRLSTRSEVSDILRAKKKSKKGGFFNF